MARKPNWHPLGIPDWAWMKANGVKPSWPKRLNKAERAARKAKIKQLKRKKNMTDKKNPDHGARAHAKLSASGSGRWMNCPGSVAAEAQYPQGNTNTIYTEEGTFAHQVADACLTHGCNTDQLKDHDVEACTFVYQTTGERVFLEDDMKMYVQEYLDYVRSHEDKGTTLMTEQRVDFSNIVPGGFGTLDAAVIQPDGTVHIFDLKYGQGVAVYAPNNTQAQFYALGMLNDWGWVYDIERFVIHIVQPRTKNFSQWEITVDDLKKFGKLATERANYALTDNAPLVPGEVQCRWCAHKANCPALKAFTEDVVTEQFEDLTEVDKADIKIMGLGLTDEEKKTVLDTADLIASFVSAIRDHVIGRLEKGEDFPGYKMVKGKANRRWLDTAEAKLVKELGQDAYNQSLVGIGDGEKKLKAKLGKDVCEVEMKKITEKPEGRPTLVKADDARPAVVFKNLEDEFENLDEGDE